MKAHESFLDLPANFWAIVRLVSQEVGYTDRKTKNVKIPSVEEIIPKLQIFDIDYQRLSQIKIQGKSFGNLLSEYFTHRATVINHYVRPRLMDAKRAEATFLSHRKRLNPSCPLPMNKQRGEKKASAYLTGIVNMIVEEHSQGYSCDYDPQKLTTITHNGMPIRP